MFYRFSQHKLGGISNFLLVHRRLDAFINCLEDDSNAVVLAGLLTNLLKLDVVLIEAIGLKLGTSKAKENALAALFQFTDHSTLKCRRR